MSDEFKDLTESVPTLTLDPVLDEVAEEKAEVETPGTLMEIEPEMTPVQKEMAGTVLTEAEQKMVADFVKTIDIENKLTKAGGTLRFCYDLFAGGDATNNDITITVET